MVDHTKPQTLNPIPVGTRVIVLKVPFDLHLEHVGATGVVIYPYTQGRARMPDGRVLYPWVYGVTLDRFPVLQGRGCWAFEHGQIVPIAPPDDVILEVHNELEAA